MTPTRRRAAWAAVVVAAVAVPAAGWLAVRPTAPPAVDPRADRRVPTGTVDSPAAATGRALAEIRPGMPRAEVEAVLGRPAPDAVGPVEESGSRAVYRARYPAELDGPVWCAPDVRGPCEVVLEYDAGRPGHPLLGATCTPLPIPAKVKAT